MKKCGYCGLETEDYTVQCYQCGREDEFVVKGGEGKMVKAPPPVPPPRIPASVIAAPLNSPLSRMDEADERVIRCTFKLREFVGGDTSEYKTVASSWGGLKRGLLTVGSKQLVLQQGLGLASAVLIGFLTLIFWAIAMGTINAITHSTPYGQSTSIGSDMAPLSMIFVVAVPWACAWWIRSFQRVYDFNELDGCHARDGLLVLQLRANGQANQRGGELALKLFKVDDTLYLTKTLSAAGIQTDDFTAKVNEAISTFQERLAAATPREWVTFVLAVVNSVIFVVLVCTQQIYSSTWTSTLTQWGADYGPLTVQGHQWWRLLTSCFLHVSILHVGFNMFALVQAGRLTERLFGNWFFLFIYLGCGLIASLTSEWFNPDIVSLGASGAVFGVYGALLGYMWREHSSFPRVVAGPVWQGATVFILWNIMNGFVNLMERAAGTATMNIDIAAHGGGLVAGLVFGFLAARPLELKERQRLTFNRAVTLAAAIAIFATALVVLVVRQFSKS